ncbi:MAG: histidine kinase dimerization/phospho-acceptor domain-containing protein [Tissierellia bacterium]|nr:histidine kinase dimerization/phospho-acceptor domain-containing protein [Tissierellia bacterium]
MKYKNRTLCLFLIIMSLMATVVSNLFINYNVLQIDDEQIAENEKTLAFFTDNLNYALNLGFEDGVKIQKDEFFNYEVEFEKLEKTEGAEENSKQVKKEYRNANSTINDTKKKGVYTIEGSYDDAIVNIKNEFGNLNKHQKAYADSLVFVLNNELPQVSDNYNTYQNVKFKIQLDFNSETFEKFDREIVYFSQKLPNFLSALVVFMALTFIIVFIIDYKKMLNFPLTKGLLTIPFEIVFIIFELIRDFAKRTNPPRMFTYNLAFMISGVLIFSFIAMLFSYYVSIVLKSIIIKRRESKVVKNSITFYLKKVISKWLRIIIDAMKSNLKFSGLEIAEFSPKKITSILVIIGIFLFFIAPFRVFLVYVFLALIFHAAIVDIIKDLSNINKYSTDIANGDYSQNIVTSKKYFNTITNNFNEIAKNLDYEVEQRVRSERFKAELITNVSHDLKTPLTSIINYSRLINEDDISKEELKSYCDIINKKSLKLKRLIEDLFEISKINSNNIEVNLTKINLTQFMIQIIGEWEDTFKEKSLEIKESFPKEPIFVNLDGDNMFRVVDNLFSNISKYAMENTRVYVKIYEDEKVNLEIKNISSVMLQEDTENLIERFKRGDESRNIEGSGLGLSIAESLVNAQNGSFRIKIDGDLFKVYISFDKYKEKNRV